jgi:uncharacterized alkaline shock family protein YloU
VTGPELTVARRVAVEIVRLAALEVPGVLRVGRRGGGPAAWLAGAPIRVRIRDGAVDARIWLVARPGQALVPLAGEVRGAVGAAIERLLGLTASDVTVVVDGVGT